MFDVGIQFSGPLFQAADKVKREMGAAVKRAGLIVEREARQTIYAGHAAGHLETGTGALRASLATTQEGLTARVGSPLIYARIHEKGGVIKAKNGPYLKFKIGGRWVQVPQVKIPARPYLAPALASKAGEVTAALRSWLDKLVGG